MRPLPLRESDTGREFRLDSEEQMDAMLEEGRLAPGDEVLEGGSWVAVEESAAFAGRFPRRLRRPGGEVQSEIEIAPLIDVVFQLLLFFMITASFGMQKGLDAPKGQQENGAGQVRRSERQLRQSYVIVDIDDRCNLKVNGAPKTAEQLVEAIKATGMRNMIITAAPHVLHGCVVRVQDAANLAGIQEIAYGRKLSAPAGGDSLEAGGAGAGTGG